MTCMWIKPQEKELQGIHRHGIRQGTHNTGTPPRNWAYPGKGPGAWGNQAWKAPSPQNWGMPQASDAWGGKQDGEVDALMKRKT